MNETPTQETNQTLTIDGLPFPSIRSLGKVTLGLLLYGILYFAPEIVSGILLDVPAYYFRPSPMPDAVYAAASVLGGSGAGTVWKMALFAATVYWLLDFQTFRGALETRIAPVAGGFVGVLSGLSLLADAPDLVGVVGRGFAAPEYYSMPTSAYVLERFALPDEVLNVTVLALAVVVVLTGQIQREQDYVTAITQIGVAGFVIGGLSRVPWHLSYYVRYNADTDAYWSMTGADLGRRIFESAHNGAVESVALAALVFAAFLLTKRLLARNPPGRTHGHDTDPQETVEA